MIRVAPAPQPSDFEAKVRGPGLSALAELIGQPPTIKRRGPKRKQLVIRDQGVTRAVTRVEDIPPDKLPALWTHALDDLLEAYERRCAYVSVYIERVTGSPSVDHWIPKSRDPHAAYEWSNFRLACSIMNSRKGTTTAILDPFEIEDGWFELELVGFEVLACPTLDSQLCVRVENTIDEFNLNCHECRTLRREYVRAYEDADINYARLRQRAPFVARELRRQGRLRPADGSC